jgi:hypothetical protein
MFSPQAARQFQWDKLLCWGVGIYAVMSLATRIESLYSLTGGLLLSTLNLLLLTLVVSLGERSLRLARAADILPYSVGWMLFSVAFDKLIVLPTVGWTMYSDVNLWVGYALIVIIPLLVPYTREKPEPASIT